MVLRAKRQIKSGNSAGGGKFPQGQKHEIPFIRIWVRVKETRRKNLIDFKGGK